MPERQSTSSRSVTATSSSSASSRRRRRATTPRAFSLAAWPAIGLRRAYGVEIPDEAVVLGPATIDGGTAAFQRAWARGERPTAVLAMSDAMAIEAMRAVADLGLAIPDDVSVVGFDDIDPRPASPSGPHDGAPAGAPEG